MGQSKKSDFITVNVGLICILTLLGISHPLFSQIPSYLPSNGLVGWWPFNGNANDESGNGNNGVVNGALLTTDRNGISNSAYDFLGSDITIPIGNSSFLNDFSISLWSKLNQFSTDYPMILQGENCYFDLNYAASNLVSYGGQSGVGFAFSGGCSVGNWTGMVGAEISPFEWSHIMIVGKNQLTFLYINGKLVDLTEYESLNQSFTLGNFLKLGSGSWSYQAFSGSIDDLAIYSRALDESEIYSIWGGQLPTSPSCNSLPGTLTSGLIGFWPLCGNALDVSGNQQNGIAVGVTTAEDRFNEPSCAVYLNNKQNCDKDWVKLPVDSTLVDSDYTISVWSKLNFNDTSLYPLPAAYPAIFEGDQCFISTTYALDANPILLNGYYVAGNCNSGPSDPGWSTQVNPSLWMNSVYVSKNDTTSLYVNGIWVSSVATPNQSQGKGKFLKFGKGHVSQDLSVFNGWIDDIGIWNRALTQQEITALYQANCSLTVGIDSLVSTTLGCQGDTITLTANANSSCQYQWYKDGQILAVDTNSMLSVTSPGWYKIKANSGVCLAADSIQITQLTAPSVSAGPDQTVCAGSYVTLSGSGSATAYSWNQGVQDGVPFVPTTTMSYILTGQDSNGCTGMDTVVVNYVGDMVQIELYSTADGAACNGTAIVNTYYPGDFSIQWSNGQTASVAIVDTCSTLCPGPFSVLINDNTNQCSYSLSGVMQNTISGADPLSTYLDISNVNNNGSCNGSASIQAYGGVPPYQYQFLNAIGVETNNIADSLCPGVYSFKVFDSQMDSLIINFLICDSTNIISNDNPIYQDSVIVDTLIVSVIENCEIDFTSVDSVWIDSYSYIGVDSLVVYWNIHDVNGIHQLINYYEVSNYSGVFNLELSLYCPQKSLGDPFLKAYDQVYINAEQAGLTEIVSELLDVWPNPFSDELFVLWNGEATHFVLMDAIGRTIEQGKIVHGAQHIDLKFAPVGVYFLNVMGSKTLVEKLVKF